MNVPDDGSLVDVFSVFLGRLCHLIRLLLLLGLHRYVDVQSDLEVQQDESRFGNSPGCVSTHLLRLQVVVDVIGISVDQQDLRLDQDGHDRFKDFG